LSVVVVYNHDLIKVIVVVVVVVVVDKLIGTNMQVKFVKHQKGLYKA